MFGQFCHTQGGLMSLVLIVDDHPAVVYAAAELIRMQGCDVAVANSGQAAMEFLRANEVGLVVLDVSMPGMSGLDVLREMDGEGMLATTPVVMYSASEQFKDRALKLGAVGFVLKHQPEVLATEIERHLCGRGHRSSAHDERDQREAT
jgi:CheY-like chemotaxis protein